MKAPIDIEDLVQWAIGQTGHLPWRGVSPRELMFDHGYTVIPKGCSREFHGAGTLLSRAIGDDANLVVEAVKRLDPAVAAIVIANARRERRPDWFVPPRRMPVFKRHRKKHRRVITGFKMIPPDLATVIAARQAYARWHAALTSLVTALDGQLRDRQISGFRAPREPWTEDIEKAA